LSKMRWYFDLQPPARTMNRDKNKTNRITINKDLQSRKDKKESDG
jgi:hypothetical protein